VGGNLGIKTFLNGTLVSNIIVDTSTVATDTIDYVATDSAYPTNPPPRPNQAAPCLRLPKSVARKNRPPVMQRRTGRYWHCRVEVARLSWKRQRSGDKGQNIGRESQNSTLIF